MSKSSFSSLFLKSLMASSAMSLALSALSPAQALIVRDDVTVEGSETLADDEKWDGVIQIFMLNNATGSVNFNCTGSLINQRTIISAAHCFNSAPGTDYGPDATFTPIIGYGPNALDGLLSWLDNGSLVLDDRNGIAFGQQVIMHPDSDLAFGNALNFPAADVAMVSLASPLDHLPNYAMLFSPVPVGTHVSMVAYGGHGVGTSGNVGIDGKRQAGENLIGMVGSFNEFFNGLEGAEVNLYAGNSPGEQGLYWLDFDNPNRTGDECARRDPADDLIGFGLGGVQCTDWNNGGFVDNTLFLGGQSVDIFGGDALENEAGTAGGDSGSALFVDELGANPLIAGVLSGGWGFVTSPSNAYGDVSYYNPLFNFYEFIDEANPYKYVSANAGNGNWSDTAHWTQSLDPNYVILDDSGAVVNGLPLGPEPGVAGNDYVEGTIYGYDVNSNSLDTGATETGDPSVAENTVSATPVTGIASGVVGSVQDFRANGAVDFSANGQVVATVAIDQDLSVPAPTPELDTLLYTGDDAIDYGAASGYGSTGFSPNNGINSAGWFNYFNVNLTANGTTTADVDVVIDNLTISGAGARLRVGEGINFQSIVDARIMAGALDVDGNFTSRDVMNIGTLTGSGAITADTVWNGGILSADSGGTLNVNGDLVLTSGGLLVYNGGNVSVDGDVSLAGGFTATNASYGDSGTVLDYTGARVGQLSAVSTGTVLQLDLNYDDANSLVSYTVSAEDYQTFTTGAVGGIGAADANSTALAGMMSANRDAQYAKNSVLFGLLDQTPTGSLADAFKQMTPHGVLGSTSASLASAETLRGQLNVRMRGNGSGAGSLASTNNPKAFSGMLLNNVDNGFNSAMALPMSAANLGPSSSSDTASGADPKWNFFGRATNIKGTQTQDTVQIQTDLDGYGLILGADRQINPNLSAGGFLNYSQTEGVVADATGGSYGIDGFVVGAFGAYDYASIARFNSYVGVGKKELDSSRGGFGGTSVGTADIDESLAGASVALLGTFMGARNFGVEPNLSVDYFKQKRGSFSESGGLDALTIGDSEYESLQLAVGVHVNLFDVASNSSAKFRPWLGGSYVIDQVADGSEASVGLVTGGTVVNLIGDRRDEAWFEGSIGLDFASTEDGGVFSAFAEQVYGRSDLDYTNVGIRFQGRF